MNIAIGKWTGNGSAKNVSIGFIPDYVRVVNVTDGDIAYEWFRGLGADDAFQMTNHDSTQLSIITSNGISTYAGSDTPGSEATPGFAVGATFNENAKVFRYVAMRNTAPSKDADA